MGLLKLIILCIVLNSAISFCYAQLPSGFTNQLVTDDLFRPLSFTFTPEGKVLIIEKDGAIKIGDPSTAPPITLTNFMIIPNINPSGEHGLIEIVLDPNFENNGYFYLYYSVSEQNKNRVSRFKDLGDPILRLNSETIIWEATDPFQGCCHTGGTLAFAQDGTLLLATGDDFGNLTAQDMTNSNGKVLRFNTDGSIPSDNPFYDTTPGDYNAMGILKSIYASGLRNPFRGSFDTQLNTLFMGEVGGNNQNFAWEDIHTIALGEEGTNFGWPACGDGSSGRESNGDCTNPAYTDPIYTYPHSGSGAAIIGGTFYRSFQYPIEYQNKYFYGDYVRNWVKYIDFDNNLNAISDVTFDSNPGLMLNFEVGPDGNLYYIRVLTAAGSNIGSGELRRYVFSDPNNTSPECISLNANPISGNSAPHLVHLDATVADADNDTINYTWDFGDGNQVSGVVPASGIIPTVTHNYQSKGEWNARLFLSDQIANTACDPITIIVGQPPTAQILSPSNNSFFIGGDTINFTGSATDPDGTLNPNNIEWYVSFYNGGTIHPRQGPDSGMATTFSVPTSNHVPFVGNTGYIVSMTVTDSDGLSATDSIFLQPEKSTVTLNSVPSGLTVLLDGIQKVTPVSFDELINFQFELNAPNQCLNDNSYTFTSWSDGGDQTHQITIPQTSTQFTANYDEFDECIICERAIELDGNSDELTLLNNVVLSDDFTIEFWANLDPNMGSADAPMSNGAQEDINFASGKVRLYTGTFSGSDQIASNFITTPNEWNHYVFVREGNTMKIYINGILERTRNVSWGADFIVAKLGLAQSSVGRFDGELDEIRLWNIARNASDIALFYNKSIEPNTIGLEAYWSFNEEDSVQMITDLTGNGHDAYLGLNASIESSDPSIVYSNLIENDCAFNYIYDNGWAPADPNGISKFTNSIIVENGQIEINTHTFCNKINLKPGTGITISNGSILTTNSGLTLESSSLNYSNLILDGTIEGDVFYKRYVNSAANSNTTTGSNDLISPPLSGQNFGDFRQNNSNILSGTINGNPAYLFGPFDSATANYINFTQSNDSDTLNAGIGYRTGSTDGASYIFEGVAQKNDVYVPITTSGITNWNLIGNPYPSYIKARSFLNNVNNSNLLDENAVGIYGYDGTAHNGWTILNLATTDENTLIAPGQGFFVNATSNGSLVFTTDMRTNGHGDDFILGRQSNPLTFLKLVANTQNDQYYTEFYFNNNATSGLDIGYDASIWNETPPNFSIYSNLVTQNQGKAIALQSLNINDINSVSIPLGVNANAGENLTLAIAESTLPSNIKVYLEDKIQNSFTLLNNESYIISPVNNLIGTGRYYLHFTDNVLNTTNLPSNNILVYSNIKKQTLNIKGLLNSNTILRLYDSQGRRLLETTLKPNLSSQEVNVSGLSGGVYVVEIKNSNVHTSKKIML